MKIFSGSTALSAFRKEKLLSELGGSVSDIAAEFVHFVDLSGKLSAADSRRLGEL
jgi:phosphoribosylformylglycinamidine synthase